MLLVFICYHCGLSVENYAGVEFERDELPFISSNLTGLSIKIKQYSSNEDLPVSLLQIKQQLREIQNLLSNDEIDASIIKFEALKRKIDTFYGEHPLLLTLYELFGNFYFQYGFLDDAQLLYKSGVLCGVKCLNETHMKLLPFYIKLSQVFKLKKLYEEEIEILYKASQCVKEEDTEKADIIKRIAEILILSRRITEAKSLFLKSLEIYRRNSELNHLKIFELYLNVSHLCIILCESEESTNYLLLAFEIYEKYLKSKLDGLIRFFQMGFDIIVRTMEDESKGKLLILSGVVQEYKLLENNSKESILEEGKKFKNLFIFLKCLLDEVIYIMKKLGGEEEFWSKYVENINIQDDFKLKK